VLSARSLLDQLGPEPLATESTRYARLEGFLREILGGGVALLHEDEAVPAKTVKAADLGWTEAVRRGFGFADVYRHQADTYRLMHAGQHVIVTTPTASGKTGAFFRRCSSGWRPNHRPPPSLFIRWWRWVRISATN
jgi:DEAD/DEAH box helicase domain-containing protein